MAKIKPESLFPRAWIDSVLNVQFITQPYISGLYVSGTQNGRNVLQTVVQWSTLSSFVKAVKNNEDIKDLVLEPLNKYLNEDELKYIT